MFNKNVISPSINSESAKFFFTIIGIIMVYAIDLLTKDSYKVDVQKDSISVTPTSCQNKES